MGGNTGRILMPASEQGQGRNLYLQGGHDKEDRVEDDGEGTDVLEVETAAFAGDVTFADGKIDDAVLSCDNCVMVAGVTGVDGLSDAGEEDVE